MTLIIRLPYTHGNKLILAHLMVSSHVYNASVSELVEITHLIGKLLSGESTVLTQLGEHSVLDWVSMCIRNLSESVLFSERGDLINSHS